MSFERARTRLALLGLVGLLGLLSIAPRAEADTSGQNQVHDPSRMIECAGKFYIYATGGGSKVSPDGLVWKDGPQIFPNGFPQWLKTLIPSDMGLWAPDVIYLNKQYYLYYAVCSSTSKVCAIGLVTSPTLDWTSSSYKWTDRGLVVANDNVVTYATIDPGPVLDANNDLWVVWGGGYANPTTANSIWVTRMDNTTGLPLAGSPSPGVPLEMGHKEGSYIHYRNGYYYLFWQTGGCCSGTASTYTINMARSQSITGPYTGNQVFYASNGNVHGPGHMGVYNACGDERFTYHYYPTNTSVLGENALDWANNWPVPGASSTTALVPCGNPGSGGTGGGGTGGAAATSSSSGPSSASTSSGPASSSSGQSSASGSGSGGASGVGGMPGVGGTAGAGGASTGGGSSSAEAASSSGAGASEHPGAKASCTCALSQSPGMSPAAQLLLVVAGTALTRRRRLRRRRSPVSSHGVHGTSMGVATQGTLPENPASHVPLSVMASPASPRKPAPQQ
jgi:hypothetical protein